MKTYLFDTINRYKRFSENLDVRTILCNKSWWAFNDNGLKSLYIFQETGDLYITTNGVGVKGKWQFVTANKSIIIDSGESVMMFHPTFVDDNILALTLDGTNNCAFFVEEGNKDHFDPQKFSDLELYFKNKLNGKGASNIPSKDETKLVCSKSILISGHESVDLGLSVMWSSMNINADTGYEYGYGYIWGDPDGEKRKKGEYSSWNRLFINKPTIDNICGNALYDTATYKWGNRWRMPTRREFEELATSCYWDLIDENHAKITAKNSDNFIVLGQGSYWTGEAMSVFDWKNQNGKIMWSICSFINCDYAKCYVPIRPVSTK